MDTLVLSKKMHGLIEEKSLLKHPFYQEWNAGTLPVESLREYAKQYYHFELAFPTFLSAVHSRCPYLPVRQHILANIWDEEYGDDNHAALWLRFASALGLTREEVENSEIRPATRELIGTYREICNTRSFQDGMAALFAYEAQVPGVAEQKIAGLKKYYGIDSPRDISFFTVHFEADLSHSSTEEEIVVSNCRTDEEAESALQAADMALDCLWRFLDGVYSAESVTR